MKIAFVFPGQGSQSVGMMKSFADLPGVRDTFSEASNAIGQDLWRLVEEGPPEELNLTVNTQPVMLAAGIALHRAWTAGNGRRARRRARRHQRRRLLGCDHPHSRCLLGSHVAAGAEKLVCLHFRAAQRDLRAECYRRPAGACPLRAAGLECTKHPEEVI